MDPQTNQTPGFGLPQPAFSADGQHAPQLAPAVPSDAISQDAGRGGLPVMPQLQQSYSTPPAGQYTVTPVEPKAPVVANVTDLSVREDPIATSDNDSALDEEWVNKAREIVQRTHADPYLQSKELGKIKAQYIKVRYNKDIKSGEE